MSYRSGVIASWAAAKYLIDRRKLKQQQSAFDLLKEPGKRRCNFGDICMYTFLLVKIFAQGSGICVLLVSYTNAFSIRWLP